MPRITYIEHNGKTHTVDVPVGKSVMQGAIENNIPGIDADCGGSMVCGTCHVFIDPPWLYTLPPASAGEAALVEYGLYPRETSRLSCQLIVTEQMDGMTVEIPPAQK